MAQTERVEAFDIGSEFGSMEKHTNQWLGLIGSIRQVYTSQLTYSANWLTPAPSWDRALDFVSIDAFYPLAAPAAAGVDDLVRAWAPWVTRLNQVRAKFGKPVVLTELGIGSIADAFRHPWVWPAPGDVVDLDAQRRFYQASCQAVQPAVAGIYWCETEVDPPPSPLTDVLYRPTGKPAEQEIGRCYAGT